MPKEDNTILDSYSDGHSDDFRVLNYLLRTIKGIKPVSSDPPLEFAELAIADDVSDDEELDAA